MPQRERSRRDVLRECLAAGALLVPARWTEAEVLHAWIDAEADRQPTAHVEMGPFYKRKAPATTKLRMPGRPGAADGRPGRVISVRGEPVGRDDRGLAGRRPWAVRPRGLPVPRLDRAAGVGAYAFESIMPGHYPARVARHVHYFVTAPGFRPLATQLYFATDEVFEGNVEKNFSKDSLITSRTLVRPVTLTGTRDRARVGRVRAGTREGLTRCATSRCCSRCSSWLTSPPGAPLRARSRRRRRPRPRSAPVPEPSRPLPRPRFRHASRASSRSTGRRRWPRVSAMAGWRSGRRGHPAAARAARQGCARGRILEGRRRGLEPGRGRVLRARAQPLAPRPCV